MNQPTLTSISPKHFSSAAHLIAVSYFDNPAHIYLCPNETTRMEQLDWLLGQNLKLQIAHGAETFCMADNNTVSAMGFWTKPNQVKVGLIAKIRVGLLKIPFKMGLKAFSRVMEVSASIEEHLVRTMGINQPYRYLNNMAIQEDMRSKGLGTKILQQQFKEIQAKDKQPVLALSTQRFRTVKFYDRLGFEVVLEEKIGKGPLAFTNWTMKKEG